MLNSHTPHTAAQEVASLVLAHALIAQTRMEAASVAGTEVLRISFGKTLMLVRSEHKKLRIRCKKRNTN